MSMIKDMTDRPLVKGTIKITCTGIKESIPLDELIIIQGNLKKLDQKAAEALENSIIEHGFFAPVFIWKTGTKKKKNKLLDGSQRTTVLHNMREKGWIIPPLPAVPILAKNLTEAKQILLKITSQYGKITKTGFIEFTDGLDLSKLTDIKFDAFNVEIFLKENEHKTKLADKFIVPPFSVINAQMPGWQARKKIWRNLIKDYGNTRDSVELMHTSTLDKDKYDAQQSVIDPVLAEVVYHWFAPDNAEVLDPFAGGVIKGFVADHYRHNFTGIEIRPEQVAINNEIAKKNKLNAIYINGSALELDKYVKHEIDLVFSRPPYWNLEVYSDLPEDLSTIKSYGQFLMRMRDVAQKCYNIQKDNRFACILIGDVRDQEGCYVDLQGGIKECFDSVGYKFYNEIIYITPIGSAAQRAGNYMKHRKVAKIHEYLLIFYKGNPAEIKNNFKELESVNQFEDTDIKLIED